MPLQPVLWGASGCFIVGSFISKRGITPAYSRSSASSCCHRSGVPVSPLSPGDSDKENSHKGSFESAQQVVTDLAEIQEEVLDEDAQALLDTMDMEVRSRLFQRCKLKQGPKHFQPYPKGWKADRARERRRTFRPKLEIDREIFVWTWNLREGLLGDTDVESNYSGSRSGDD